MLQRRIVLGLALFSTLVACTGQQRETWLDWDAQKLYQESKAATATGHFKTAAQYQSTLLAQYPTSTFARQALLDSAYNYYQSGNREQAEAQLAQFIRNYPRDAHVDYAYYMQAVVRYNDPHSLLNKLIPANHALTDPSTLRQSFDAFAAFIQKFPNSRYREDARQRMIFLKNLLAQHELEIADYYLRERAYIAAIARAKTVLSHYDRTPSVPYALALMSRAYRALGQKQAAKDSLLLLQKNFPNQSQAPGIQAYLKGSLNFTPGIWASLNDKPKI